MSAPQTPETPGSDPDEPAHRPTAVSVVAGTWERIKEHKVLQWGLAYLGAALALAHGADLLSHAFHWPESFNRLLLGVLIVGFPVALALAWYHGHRSLRTISTGEATIISILLLIGAGLLVLFVRPPAEETADAAVGQRGKSPAIMAADGGPSIVVLPFINMSSDREQDYFSDGLSEELLNELTHVPNLRVIGRTSSFAFKGKNEDLRTIGETLGVDHILEGSVRKAGETLRITAQLINPSDGSHLWSGTYDRKVGDVFEIQEEIARTVAASLRLSIEATNLRAGGTHNFEAYDEFLRGRASQTDSEAIEHLQRAVELAPQFTQAWLTLAAAYDTSMLFEPSRAEEWLRKGREAGDRVLALAPQSAEAKILLGTRASEAGNFQEAESLFQAAHDRNLAIASGVLPQFLLGLGRPHDALAGFEAAKQLDPVSAGPRLMLQVGYEEVGNFSQADLEYKRAIALLPNGDLMRPTAMVRAMAQRDAATLRALVAATKASPLAANEVPVEPDQVNVRLGALLDNPAAALGELHRWSIDPNGSRQPFVLLSQAHWAAYLGDPELSLQLLRRMPRDHHSTRGALMLSLWRPVEKNMRRLPAFKLLVTELGLVKYWRATGNWGEFCHPLGEKDFECD